MPKWQNILDSYWHKDEKIPESALEEALVVKINEPGGKFVDGTDPLDAAYMNGRVGIGTLTPTAKQEIVNTDPTLDYFHLGNGLSGDIFNVNSLGNVGVGTSTPNEKIDIDGRISLRVVSTTGSINTIRNDGLDLLFTNNAGAERTLLKGRVGIGFINIDNSGNQSGGQTTLGEGAGAANTGSSQTALGNVAGINNSGFVQVATGRGAGTNNTAIYQVASGYRAGTNNAGRHQVTIGGDAGRDNTGANQIYLGLNAGRDNTGVNQIALGANSGQGNTGDYNIHLGENSGVLNSKSNAIIVANEFMPNYADRASAAADLTVVNGCIVGNTYMYYNETTFAIEGVRL
jgi:hypothetical protein